MKCTWMRLTSVVMCICMLFALMGSGVSAELSGVTGVVPTDEYTFFDFEDFKEMCLDSADFEDTMVCVYTGYIDFAIESDLTIPQTLTLKTDGAGIHIPAGVTVTLEGKMEVSDLRLDGKLCNHGTLELICEDGPAMTVADAGCYEDLAGDKTGRILVEATGEDLPNTCISGMDMDLFSAEKIRENEKDYWELTISQDTEPEEDPNPEEEPKPEEPQPPKVEVTPMYRLYNPNSGEHFYTGSAEERDMLEAAGWHYEGVAWNAPTKSGAPVHRLYNPNSGDHHYTMSLEERDMLVNVGWQYEGVAWNSASASHVPQYRLYNPNADCGSHHYTGSAEERDYLVSLGWHFEGIGWYGIA